MNSASKIRAALRANTDGMTARELSASVGLSDHNDVKKIAERMPDTYIDRWTTYQDTEGRKIYTPVWCVVVPPENCPKPQRKAIA